MKNEIKFTKNDSVVVIAPHPDDECIGAAAPLLMIPQQTDIYILTDGCYGNPEHSCDEEAALRKDWLEEEMSIVKPRNWFYLGYEDTKLSEHPEAVAEIDFTKYTKIFLPWLQSLHPDHRAASKMCLDKIEATHVNAECYFYEVCAPFHNPRHYIDITNLIDRKTELVKCYKEMDVQVDLIRTLNHFRAVQMMEHPEYEYIEAYERKGFTMREDKCKYCGSKNYACEYKKDII